MSGWDDPRMPTLCGLRRRGYTPEAIRDFLERIGVAKADSVVEAAMLEHCVREDLNAKAPRYMAVLDPVKLVIDNWPAGKVEEIELENHPSDLSLGKRKVKLTGEVYIEREDFSADPPKKFFRLKPEGEVRLKGAYIVKCTGWKADDDGRVTEIHCTYDPESKSGEDARKVKGTLHWVDGLEGKSAEFRLYDSLIFDPEGPEDTRDFKERLNPDSLKVMRGFIEPALADQEPGGRFQFMRVGYFCTDPDGSKDAPVFNRIVGLKDSYKG